MTSSKSRTDTSIPASNQDETDSRLDDRAQTLRSDFPALSQTVNGQPLVYLDNAATSQKPRSVIDRLRDYYENENSNVHRGVHTLSQSATDAYESARQTAASFIGASSPSEIVFTKGTTESINLVSRSFVQPGLREGDQVILTVMEHHSNIVPWQMICESTGAEIKVVEIDEKGCLDYASFESLLNERTKMVAIGHISNALGTINPVRRMIVDAHALNIPVLIDGAQAVPHQAVNVAELDCDFYAFSGHKMYGPTGIGVLFGKEALLDKMPPWQGGGDMIERVRFSGTTFAALPHKFEAGTPNIAGVVGLAAAMDYVTEIGYRFISAHEDKLMSYAVDLLSQIDGLRLIGTAPDRAGVISFLLGRAHPYDVGTILDRLGIAVRTGHHCAEPLMDHLGIPGTVRASFAFYNTIHDVDRLISGLTKASSMLS